jgi:hypothetical protein
LDLSVRGLLEGALVLAQELRPEDLTTFIERGSAEYAYSGDPAPKSL